MDARRTHAHARVVLAVVAAALLANGCLYIPFVQEAASRDAHARLRTTPASQEFLRARRDGFSCLQLSDWERAVVARITTGDTADALSPWSLPVLREDLFLIRAASHDKGCPSRAEMLSVGTPTPAPGAKLDFRCVCWRPYGYLPLSTAEGPAGPGCVTVRAELTPGRFVFFEQVPNWGERRHETTGASTVYGTLDREQELQLLHGRSSGWSQWTTTEGDGWVRMRIGDFRVFSDDCRAPAPEADAILERTIIRWLEASPG